MSITTIWSKVGSSDLQQGLEGAAINAAQRQIARYPFPGHYLLAFPIYKVSICYQRCFAPGKGNFRSLVAAQSTPASTRAADVGGFGHEVPLKVQE